MASLEGDFDWSRPPIGKTLAGDALEGFVGAVLIVNAKRNAIRIAEIELCEVAMQVLFLAVLVHTAHAAFEN